MKAGGGVLAESLAGVGVGGEDNLLSWNSHVIASILPYLPPMLQIAAQVMLLNCVS